jgi:hypothetical protein
MTDRELRELLELAAERQGRYPGAPWVADWLLEEHPQHAEPVAWLRVVDEAMIVHECGVVDPADNYETAKNKLNTLLCIVQDAGNYFSKQQQAEPVAEPVVDRAVTSRPNERDYASFVGYARALELYCDGLEQAEPAVELVAVQAWIQPDHLQQALAAPFLCRVEPTQRCPDFIKIYTDPPKQAEPVVEPVVDRMNTDHEH